MWIIEFCTCGFGGGDMYEEFATRDEVLQRIEQHEAADWSNASIMSITSPSGIVSRKKHLGFAPEVPEA